VDPNLVIAIEQITEKLGYISTFLFLIVLSAATALGTWCYQGLMSRKNGRVS